MSEVNSYDVDHDLHVFGKVLVSPRVPQLLFLCSFGTDHSVL